MIGLLVLGSLDLLLDYTFRFDRAQRGVLLAAMVLAVAWACYRWLFRPLAAPLTDDALALTVERAHPHLQQRLISGLQLARQSDSSGHGLSSTLTEFAIQNASRLAETISFDAVLNQRRHARNRMTLLLASSLTLAVIVGVLSTQPLQRWFRRNLLLADANWPQDTHLVIERLLPDGTVVFPRGLDWQQAIVIGDASRSIPDTVDLDIRAGGNTSTLTMKSASVRRFEAAFRGVTESFEFRARGGDARTEWVRVRLEEPPDLKEVRLFVTPPPYTALAESELAPGEGPYSLLPGSSLRLSAQANKPLARASLTATGRPLKTREVSRSSEDSTFTLEVSADRLNASIPADSMFAGTYAIELEDEFGLPCRRPLRFVLDARVDQVPQVLAELRGTSNLIVPSARIPFQVSLGDDYGLTQLAAQLETVAGSNLASSKRTMPLTIPGDHPKQFRLDDAIDLAPIALTPGVELRLWFESRDNNDIAGPQTGRSSTFTFHVVTPAELRADLLRREKQLREQMGAANKEQAELVTEMRVLSAAIRSFADWMAEHKEQLSALQKRQKNLGDRLATFAERLQSIALELVNNRLEEAGSPLVRRFEESIAAPLERLAAHAVPAALDALSSARAAPDATTRNQALSATIGRQQQVHDELTAIIDEMAGAEGFQEAINLLYEIEKAQLQVLEQTNKARQERIERLLNGQPPAPKN